jgi:hypothetical protein
MDMEHECEFTSPVPLLGKAYLFRFSILSPSLSEIEVFCPQDWKEEEWNTNSLPGTFHISSSIMVTSL